MAIPTPPPPDDGGTVEVGDLATLEGPLLNVDVNVDVDTDLTAPIAGAVAANANVAAPISAAFPPTSCRSTPTQIAISTQDAVINQDLRGITTATSDQVSDVTQGTSQPDAGGTASGDTVRCEQWRWRRRRQRRHQWREQWRDQQRFCRVIVDSDPGALNRGKCDVTVTTESAVATQAADRRADGVELIGEMVGSGYRVPPSLVRRADGQTIQLTPLLYSILREIDGRSNAHRGGGRRVGSRPAGPSVRTTSASLSTTSCALRAWWSFPMAVNLSSRSELRCWGCTSGVLSPTPTGPGA